MDLRKLIAELMAAGVSQVEIAEKIGTSQATVSRYASGEIKSCEYGIGAALIELHLLRVLSVGAVANAAERPAA